MTLILASGDHHFDEHSRFDECKRVHAWMADEVARAKPAVFLSGGDIYERASTPLERQAVADWLAAVAETCPVVVVKGNHDRPLDLEILRRLKTRHPVIIEERCGVHVVNGVAIGAMAWPNRASLATMVGKPMSGEGLDVAARECIQHVLRGLGGELQAHDGPKLLLGHFMVDGAVTSVGQPLVGAEFNVPLADFALAGVPIVIAGHIHKPQHFDHGMFDVVYTGSPFRTAFGEVEEKSVLRVEFEDQNRARWSRITTPAAPMVLLTATWWPEAPSGGAMGYPCEDDERGVPPLNHRMAEGEFIGAEVRYRYKVASDHRAAARRAASEVVSDLFAAGAVSVKVEEEVVATTRARVPEIAKAATTRGKLEAMWRARGAAPEPARAERIFAKLAQIEEGS